MSEDAPQREHSLREIFNGLRWMIRTGAPWRLMPNDLPPWFTVYQQAQRCLKAGVFEAIVNDLRESAPRIDLFTGKVKSCANSAFRAI